ncbi:MAG: SRPBCC domain-containing protein [Microbacterium sp.]|nr:SRPBCC domain-containing protein [Microbacterium sp.]
MTDLDIQRVLAAVAEPTRFRIVDLLAERARTVSEIQEAIGARQPQTTKHVQTLEAAQVIRVHRLGRRRVAQLDRSTMARLGEHFAMLSASESDDAALEEYAGAILAEERGDGRRMLTFERTLLTSVERVWTAWTDQTLARRWWAPRHFEVEEFALSPIAGSSVRLTLREGGARYTSAGRVREAVAPSRLVFTMAPVDEDGQALFDAVHTLTLTGDSRTELRLRIDVSEVRDGAASAVAGLEPGWNQLLDALEAALAE